MVRRERPGKLIERAFQQRLAVQAGHSNSEILMLDGLGNAEARVSKLRLADWWS